MDDLDLAQSSLGRALGRARAGEDRELAQKVREGGEQLVQLIAGLLKLSRVHSPDNRAFDAPVAELARLLAALGEALGTVNLVMVEDQVYLNDIRVRTDNRPGAGGLGAELKRHNTGGLVLYSPLTGPQIRVLVKGLAGPPAAEWPRGALGGWLLEQGLGAVELHGIHRFQAVRTDQAPPDRSPEQVLRLLVERASEAWDHLAAGRMLNPLPIRRAVAEALESGIEAPAFWLGLPDCLPHAAHAVEVAMVALLVGKAAGFSATVLQDLGIAGLVHDVGYLAPSVGEGPAGLARHPVEGARLVLRQRGFSEAKLRRLRAVLEHHRDQADPAGPPSPAGAVLRLAEDYANVIRLYGAKVARADALGAMLKAGGRLYHPALVQAMVNALGRHPPGTLVELSDGGYGRVAAPARGPDLWDRPLVKRLDAQTRLPTGPLVDTFRDGAIRRALAG
jgi:HD domain